MIGFRSPLPILGLFTTAAAPEELPYQSDAYQYDSSGGTGSITGGTVLSGPAQTSPTGSISGGTVLPPEQVY